jgi:cytoskeleton protein RodZ
MDTRDIGAELRASREARGLSISLLAQRTRVQPRFLTAIEHNDLSAIPPKPFGRGFVKAFATEVGLDPEETVRDYFARFAPVTVVPDVPVRPSAPDPTQPTFRRWTPLVLAAIAIATIGLLTFNRGSSPDRIPDAVGTTGATSPSAGSPPRSVASTGATGSAPTPVAASQPRHLLVTLDVSRICWVTATADGQRTIYTLL